MAPANVNRSVTVTLLLLSLGIATDDLATF